MFTDKTGTGLSSEVQQHSLYKGVSPRLPVMAKVALVSIGAGATITIAIEGLRTADETWETLRSKTVTGFVGSVVQTKYLTCDVPKKRRRYRLSITANTNVQVNAGHIGIGTVED